MKVAILVTSRVAEAAPPFALVLVIALLLAQPAASAQGGTQDGIELRSAADVALDGTASIRATGAVVRIDDDAVFAAARFTDPKGELTIVEVEARITHLGGLRQVVTDPRVTTTTFKVRGPDASLLLDHEPLRLRVVPRDEAAFVVVGAATVGTGKPTNLTRDIDLQTGVSVPWDAPELALHWQRGWGFVGDYLDAEPLKGFPSFAAPRLDIRGDVSMQIHGGTLRFTDAQGNAREERLGDRTTQSTGDVAGASVRTETWRYALWNGTLSSTDVPLGGSWLVGAPVLSWNVEGEVLWQHATGRARIDGRVVHFEDATLRAQGALALAPSPVDALATAHRYAGEGELDSLALDGQRVEAPASRAPVVAASVSFLALLPLLAQGVREALTRGAYLLYTRITAAEALTHPSRARIYREVVSSPGIHLRELHRRAGGGWGIFRAHLHLLRALGYVRAAREGRNLLLYASGAALPAATARLHATARGIVEALPPAQGLTLPELRERLGLSRQLIAHHVARLERSGLVRVEDDPARGRVVRPAEGLAA